MLLYETLLLGSATVIKEFFLYRIAFGMSWSFPENAYGAG
jgi:hypothetical protein